MMMEAARRHILHHETRRPMRETTTRFITRIALAFQAFVSDTRDDRTRLN
jgi:hypothetical protein